MTTLSEAVATGDRRATLEALRRHIAERIEAGVPPRELAALSLQLMKVVRALDEAPQVTSDDRRQHGPVPSLH
jgi:hypothetical protein